MHTSFWLRCAKPGEQNEQLLLQMSGDLSPEIYKKDCVGHNVGSAAKTKRLFFFLGSFAEVYPVKVPELDFRRRSFLSNHQALCPTSQTSTFCATS